MPASGRRFERVQRQVTARDRGSRVRDPRSLISRRINAERIVLLGWGRAILLQLAHPLIAAGVHDHSGFRATTWAAITRLYHTVHAMLALTFGTDEERERALGGIRQIHQRVNGQLRSAAGRFPAGTAYSAEDPDLVLWVHATLLESVPLAYEQLVGPLTIAERDAYCAEAAPVAVALLARSHEVPRTWAEARVYLDRMYASGDLVVTDEARALARAVLSPAGSRLDRRSRDVDQPHRDTRSAAAVDPPAIRLRLDARASTDVQRAVRRSRPMRRVMPQTPSRYGRRPRVAWLERLA